ncbi:tyrosine-protein phosphatase [Streptomyces sp. NPDC058739]|uniref:tyrosine-protein phosphatase n=1 Tax=Streptomyces sp. NPDC058739 TaxID=3346618 RepID=UPI0036CA87D4
MDRHIPFESLANFRDLGGYSTTDGLRVRPGRLYRADSLGKLRPDTPALLADWSADDEGRTPARPAFGRAPAEVMTLFLAATTTRYGSIDT